MIIAYINNELDQDERGSVEEWLSKTRENRLEFNRLKYIWDNSAADREPDSYRKEEVWKRIIYLVIIVQEFMRLLIEKHFTN